MKKERKEEKNGKKEFALCTPQEHIPKQLIPPIIHNLPSHKNVRRSESPFE